MSEKQKMLDIIRDLSGNDYQELESYRLILLTLLLFIDNNETDSEIWEEFIGTIRNVVNFDERRRREHGLNDTEESIHLLNRKDVDFIRQENDRYHNLDEIKKMILSKRVMCPNVEGINFSSTF